MNCQNDMVSIFFDGDADFTAVTSIIQAVTYDIGDGALLRERAVWRSRSTGPRNEFLHANEDLAFCPAATSPTAR